MKPNLPEHRQITAIVLSLQLFSLLLILLQLWAFVTVLEAAQGGEARQAWVFAGLSVVLLAVNGWMLVAIRRLERRG